MKGLMKSVKYFGLALICLVLCLGWATAQTDKKPSEAATEAKDAKAAKNAEETAPAEADMKAKDVVVDTLRKIEYDNPDFKVQVMTLDGKRTYRIGDRIGFKFRTNSDAYVTIIDVGTSGKTHVLFPNKWHRDNRVKANRWYRIPPKEADYGFKVNGPSGVNYVKAIATSDAYDFVPRDAVFSGDNPFFEIKNPELAVKDIGVELNKREKRAWTEYEDKFRIVDRRQVSYDDDDDRDMDRPKRHHRDRDRDRDYDRDWERPRRDRDRRHMNRDTDRDWDRDQDVVKLWTDQKRYRIGDPVYFYFYADRDCYLNLVSFGTSGRVRVIFPNRFQKDNYIKGGQVVEIPGTREDKFLFRVDGPPGTEVVKAVATRHKYQVYRKNYDWDRNAYQIWEDKPENIEEDIRSQLGDLPDDYYVRAKTTFKVEP